MMMKKDDWLRAALKDDGLVAELLFRLKESSSEVSMPSPPISSPPVSWGLRLPRSKLTKSSRKDSTTTTTRYSPRTPLSWSCTAAASVSDGGYDESSVNCASSDPSRSKGTFTSEVTNICSTNKRSSRKKKTFSELQEEEIILLKDRNHLKTELASVNVTLKEQRVRSKNLKRIKIDFDQQSGISGAKSGKAVATVPNKCKIEALTADQSFSSSCIVQEEDVDTTKGCFILPDLNMMPTDNEIAA